MLDDDRSADTALAPPELSLLLVQLLKGVIYRDDDERLWARLLHLQPRLRDHATVLLLELIVDEAEGYAFLKSRSELDATEDSARIPRLIHRRQLPYRTSLMLALLRKRLAEFDTAGGDTRLVLRRDEIAEMMRLFFADSPNEARQVDHIDRTIGKVVELGFLRRLKPPGSGLDNGPFEVRRILKAFVDAQWLADFDARLAQYRDDGDAGEDARDG